MESRPLRRSALRGINVVYCAVILAGLYVPLLLLIIFSFNDAKTLVFPLKGFTLAWYAQLWQTPELLAATWNSLLLGIGSAAAATIIGSMAAVGLVRFRFIGRGVFIAIAMLPLVIPSVVLGVGLLIGFAQAAVPLSLWTVGAGHVVINLPIVMLIVMARLVGMDENLEEAAMDLGASYWHTQLRITFPLALPAMIAAFLTAFTTSFDEFALTFFLAGTEPTLPLYLYSQLRFPARLPMVVATASVIIVASFLLILIAEWLRRWGESHVEPLPEDSTKLEDSAPFERDLSYVPTLPAIAQPAAASGGK